MAEINVSKLLNKLLPEAEEEAGTVYNKGALGTLRSDQDADNALAAQLAAGTDAPLTQQPFASALSGLKIQPKDVPASSADVPVNLSESAGNLGDAVPANAETVSLDPNQDVTGSVSPDVASKWQQYKKAIIPTAAAGAAGAGYLALSGKDNTPAASAAQPPQSASPADDIPDSEYDAMDSIVAPDKSSNGAATAVKPASSDDDSDDEDSTASKSPVPDNTVTPNIASVQKMQDMQQRANQLQALIGAARGATQTAYAMSGKANPFDQQFQTQMGQAGQLPEQYKQLVDFQKQDPNSAISQTYRQMASQLGMPISDQTSGAEIEKAFPQIVNIKTREDMIAARKEMASERLMQMQSNNELRRMMLENQLNTKQNQTFDNTVKLLEQLRGSPAVSQAEKDIYNGDKALELKNTVGGNWQNANPQMIKLFINEVGKIAAGGTSTESELQALTPNTLRSKFAGVWQELSSNPTPANLGKFMDQYETYAKGIKSVGQGVIKDRYGRIIDTVGSHLSPDQNALLQEKYVNRFIDPMPGQPGYSAPQSPASKQPSANQPAGTQPLGNQQGSQQKQVVKKGYNPKTNQTQYIYSDGTKAIVDGQQ